LNSLRASKERFTEEVDAVALHGDNVLVVAEAKWTNKPLGAKVLADLLDHKVPALRQAGFKVADAELVLASRSGFSAGLLELAQRTPKVVLVDAASVLDDLKAEAAV
jgi:hypothetical protein